MRTQCDVYHIQDLQLEDREKVYKECDVKSLLKFGQVNPTFTQEILKVRDMSPLWFGIAELGTHEWIKPISVTGFDVNSKDKCGRTALIEAANYGQLKCAELFIDVGVKVEARDNWKDTALHTAAERGFLSIVKLLVENKADVNSEDRYGVTPLSSVAADKHGDDKNILRIMKTLIDAGANPNIVSNHKETALHHACQYWKVKRIELLLKANAEVNVKSDEGLTPLHYVVCFRTIPTSQLENAKRCIKKLVKAGADINTKDNQGLSVLRCASRNIRDYIKELGGKK
jgi:ankyrin repeat protein